MLNDAAACSKRPTKPDSLKYFPAQIPSSSGDSTSSDTADSSRTLDEIFWEGGKKKKRIFGKTWLILQHCGLTLLKRQEATKLKCKWKCFYTNQFTYITGFILVAANFSLFFFIRKQIIITSFSFFFIEKHLFYTDRKIQEFSFFFPDIWSGPVLLHRDTVHGVVGSVVALKQKYNFLFSLKPQSHCLTVSNDRGFWNVTLK